MAEGGNKDGTARITAAMVVIGDEILSGRTRDSNSHHLAGVLTMIGIELMEVRFVGDDETAIVEALTQLRRRNTYVFTSGGIGPTHDDITADAVATAFGLPVEFHPQALAILTAHYAERGLDFTDARKRMARMPEGASLIDNPVSRAPGFIIGNVHVMAGVPAIFQAMLDNVVPQLRTGQRMLSETVHCDHGEGVIGTRLGEIQNDHPETLIGSYPKFKDGRFWTEIVVRSRDSTSLANAIASVETMTADLDRSAPRKAV